MKDYVVQANHVTKQFDDQFVALDDVHFGIRNNTRLAILGHNGSGKSTLLKLIAGIYAPTEGELTVKGKKIGYVPEHFPDHIRFRLGEYLQYLAKMEGLTEKEAKRKLAYYSDLFQLGPYLNTFLKHCSKGTKQKAGLLQAIMTDCDILLLDEPLTGLDDESKKAFLDLLQGIGRDVTLIFTAHEQEAVELLAEEILVLENGKIARYDAVTELTKMKQVTARVSGQLKLEELKVYGRIESVENRTVVMTVPDRESDSCLLYLLNKGCSIIEVKEELQ